MSDDGEFPERDVGTIRKVTNKKQMFYNCSSLTCIKVGTNWNKAMEVSNTFTNAGVSGTTTDNCIVTN